MLFEILSLFRVLDALKDAGWSLSQLGQISGGLVGVATRSGQVLDIYYKPSGILG